MGILDTLGLSSSAQDQRAAQAKQAQLAATKKQLNAVQGGTQAAVGDIRTGYTAGAKALAPAITNVGNYLSDQNAGYDVLQSAYGIGDSSLASDAYARSLQPGTDKAYQDILRNRAAIGGVRSGGTGTDFADYVFNTQYNPWRTGLAQFDPYQAIALQGTLGGALSNIYTGQAGALSGLHTGLANAQSDIYGNQGAAKAGYFDKLAANQGQVGQNILGLAGNILGAGATLAGMRVPGAGAAAALPQAAIKATPQSYGSTFPAFV